MAIALGAACGVKWSAVYYVAIFAVAVVLFDVSARRSAGFRHWIAEGLWSDGAIWFFGVFTTFEDEMFTTFGRTSLTIGANPVLLGPSLGSASFNDACTRDVLTASLARATA